MSWQTVLIHSGYFLLLPLFAGCFTGALARLIFFPRSSLVLLMVAGFLGSLSGLVLGWLVTGSDGHALSYILLIILCSFFISFTAGDHPKKLKK